MAAVLEALARRERRDLLRFITCGSVDDGKSTLIGRLLFESRALFDDQWAALEADSRKWGTQGDAPDLALLLDGLAAEREQGITIDVAYRFFGTDRRQFIVADTPGHEQYTRNMATGASTADLALILVDARKGVQLQTRRHCCIAALLGIRQLVLAVNKMDLVGFERERFEAIAEEARGFAARLGVGDITAIPLSALRGDNVTARSESMPWYAGPTLMAALEAALPATLPVKAPLRLPVQWVNRPHADLRGFCGLVAAGRVRPGDRVTVQPSGRCSTVGRVVAAAADVEQAEAGQSVMLTLADEIDISRGDLICAAESPAEVADQFEATIVWMDAAAPLLPGRPYWLKIGARTVGASVTEPKYRLNVETLERLAARKLELNDIGVCNIALDRAIAFDPYERCRDTGGFILIDRTSNHTVGAGLLHFALRRAHNLRWQALDVDVQARRALNGHGSATLWFTGLSGAGKSTIANALARRLHAMGVRCYVLDGDNVRHGLNRDLGFTDVDRVENIRRVAEVARLMVDAGIVVIAAFISPFAAERAMARARFAPGEFFEVFVDAPLAVAEARDAKGLYAKARRGELANFTGIDSAYDAPRTPELRIDTTATAPETATEALVDLLRGAGVLPASEL